MTNPIQKKDIAICIILSIVTCGIYGIIWFVSLTDDVRIASEDQTLPSGGTAFLLTLVTCGIYGFYWAYRMGQAVNTARTKRGLAANDSNSILYLILQVFGLGIVTYCLIQNELNGFSTTEPSSK